MDDGIGRSGNIARLQGGEGEVDDLEPLFRRLVAAMHVGVVELHEFLIARLEAAEGERRNEVEHGERLVLRRGCVAARLRAAVGSVGDAGPVTCPVLGHTLRPVRDDALDRTARCLLERASVETGR